MRGIALEIEDALGGQAEEVADLIVAGIPQMPVVARVFDDHFMRADRVHAVIDAVAAAAGFAFDAIERHGMHDGARGPGNAGRVGRLRDHLRGRRSVGAETAGGLGTRSVSAGSSPVMTQERVMGSLRSSIGKENTGGEAESTAISAVISRPSMRNDAEGRRRALL